MIRVVFLAFPKYNKNVMNQHIITNKSVKMYIYIYGTIDFEKTAGLEEFFLPQAFNPERCASGR